MPLSDEAIKLIERLPRTATIPVHRQRQRQADRRHDAAQGALAMAATTSPCTEFRSGFRDWGGERTSAPRELLEVALAHALGSAAEEAYARGDLIEKRRGVMQQWAKHCATPAAGHTAKVVTLAGRHRHG